jgi:hypothetical protein
MLLWSVNKQQIMVYERQPVIKRFTDIYSCE